MDYFFYESAPDEMYAIFSKEVASRDDIIKLCKILHEKIAEENFE
jgi:hypothetical protein